MVGDDEYGLRSLFGLKELGIIYVEVFQVEITINLYVQRLNETYEVCHWVEDEWIEDPLITPVIANAIRMAYTSPDKLLTLNYDHIKAQFEEVE